MKALLQRVKNASVKVDDEIIGQIDAGLLVFVGVQKQDDLLVAKRMLDKILNYRIFSDSQGKMNLNLAQTQGGLLIVSQFTLVANTSKGLRPSFSSAGSPAMSLEIYQHLINYAKTKHKIVQEGLFGADMQVSLTNDGPATFMLDVVAN